MQTLVLDRSKVLSWLEASAEFFGVPSLDLFGPESMLFQQPGPFVVGSTESREGDRIVSIGTYGDFGDVQCLDAMQKGGLAAATAQSIDLVLRLFPERRPNAWSVHLQRNKPVRFTIDVPFRFAATATPSILASFQAGWHELGLPDGAYPWLQRVYALLSRRPDNPLTVRWHADATGLLPRLDARFVQVPEELALKIIHGRHNNPNTARRFGALAAVTDNERLDEFTVSATATDPDMHSHWALRSPGRRIASALRS